MGINQVLIEWQHYNEVKKQFNFVIGRSKKDNQIHGILGFIPNSHFDKKIKQIDLALALWKVREDVKAGGLGISLIRFLEVDLKPRSIYGIGINPVVLPIYKYMGFKLGSMSHYYIVNTKKKNFNLISNFDGIYFNEKLEQSNAKLVKYEKSDFENIPYRLRNYFDEPVFPLKSHAYVFNKYFSHPFYDYQVFGVIRNGLIIGIAIFRVCSFNSSYSLRLVEYIGPGHALGNLYKELQKLLQYYNAEYVDLYNMGIDQKYFLTSGFLIRSPRSNVQVPNYFEPFNKNSIDLNFAFKQLNNDDINFSIYKADSDQDRPNLV